MFVSSEGIRTNLRTAFDSVRNVSHEVLCRRSSALADCVGDNELAQPINRHKGVLVANEISIIGRFNPYLVGFTAFIRYRRWPAACLRFSTRLKCPKIFRASLCGFLAADPARFLDDQRFWDNLAAVGALHRRSILQGLLKSCVNRMDNKERTVYVIRSTTWPER